MAMCKNNFLNDNPFVSVVVPIYNEEKYIVSFLETIKEQDYDMSKIELILIDGVSTDDTVNLIKKKLINSKIKYKILENSKRITPISLNIGIKESSHNIIIRLDAHSTYPKNYIKKCVTNIVEHPEADNVGCLIETESKGVVGKAISHVLSSKFGVGNSQFRTNAHSGYVDTVPFGTFRKELFYRIGFFDERLARNQDSEFNSRIIKNGGKIYLFDDVKIKYYPRETILKLMKMGFQNGKWNVYTSYLVSNSMRMRHFVPLAFVLSIFFGMLSIAFDISLFKILFGLEVFIYFVLDFAFSVLSKNILLCLISFIIYPLFHFSYGFGSIYGLLTLYKMKKEKEYDERNTETENKR